jgi:hypothetical protein
VANSRPICCHNPLPARRFGHITYFGAIFVMPKAPRSFLIRGEMLESRQMLVVPDFQLTDINDASETFNQNVSPRDFMGEVTAWYFIRSF